MKRDEIQAELNAELRARDSLAQFLGYWMLQNKEDIYPAISALRYQRTRTSPISDERVKDAEEQIDRLFHEWNRTQSAYRWRTKRIEELRAKLKAAPVESRN